ncbi:MAG: peptide ABC transporter substrate-binding protein [Candidatus Doudnabacteria bacterium]|nr:peptide ABC transporter substrate-binding protein [Candidatus Doudnabacteria bacterium]
MTDTLRNILEFFKRAWTGIRMIPRVRSRHLPQIFESLTKKDFVSFTAMILLIVISGGFLLRQYVYGGTGTIPDYGGEHIEGLVGQPRFINPILAASSSVDSDLSRLMYAQLIKFDRDLKLTPDLALSLPEISADQKTYTLKLKPNLKWQDEKPITADDVIFTVQTIQNPDFESPLAPNWNRVRVEKIDDLTVKFTLHTQSATFITNFTLGIIPKHFWDGMNPGNFRLSDKNLRPVGSGPYSVREIKKTSDGTIKSLTLKSSDTYYGGKAYITYLTFKFYQDEQNLISAYQSRDVQSIGFIPFDNKVFLQSSDKSNQYQISLPQYQAVFFNLTKSSVITEKAVRQALWLATDRNTVINDVYLGHAKPAFGPILEGNLGYTEAAAKATHTDLTEAGQILDKAGWIMDTQTNTRYKTITTGSGKTKTETRKNLEFSLATNVSPLNVKTAEILEQQWEQIGVTVHLVIVSGSDLQDDYIRPRNFETLLFSENTGADPDPFPFWHSSQSHDPGLNLSGFSNPTVDKLLTEARQTNDTGVRAKDYQQFQDIVTQELPAIFLDSAVYVYTVPRKEQGIDLKTIIHPSERFLDVNHWYIDTKRN